MSTFHLTDQQVSFFHTFGYLSFPSLMANCIDEIESAFEALWGENGGGHHDTHVHWDNHISGFYFLKGSEKTSKPMFEDPRPGNMMNLLPQKCPTKITYASHQISYEANPGKMIFFPSYMPHQYVVDMGYEPFRFIHFNCQAIPKGALNVFQKK